MNTLTDFDRRAAAWLADGPTELNDRVLDAALREVHITHQRRRWPAPWSAGWMTQPMQAAAAVGVVALAGVLAFALLRPLGPGGPGPTSTPIPTTVPTQEPTTAPSPTNGPTPRIPGATVASDGLRLTTGVRYVLAEFEPAFSFTGAGITFGIDGQSYAWFEHPASRNAAIGVVQPRTAFTEAGGTEPVPTDIVAWLQGRADLVISSTTAITLGTAEGTLLEGTVRPDAFHNAGNAVNLLCPDATGCDFESGGSLGYAPGDHAYILVTAVDGVAVAAIATASEAVWPDIRADADAFLRSFEFPG